MRLFTTFQERSLQGGGSSKAGELLSRMLTAHSETMADKIETDHDVLRYALTWKPWAGFISFHGKE